MQGEVFCDGCLAVGPHGIVHEIVADKFLCGSVELLLVSILAFLDGFVRLLDECLVAPVDVRLLLSVREGLEILLLQRQEVELFGELHVVAHFLDSVLCRRERFC